MASRRLDISSLLCNDDVPEPVILAPHLTQSSTPSYARPAPSMSSSFSSLSPALQSQRPSSSHSHSSRQSIHRLSPPSNPYPLPPASLTSPHNFPSPPTSVASKQPYIGLEALVHAATEERRRLSGGSTSESDILRRPSPPVELRHPPQQFHQLPSFRQRRSGDYIPSSDHHQSPTLGSVQAISSPVQTIRSPVQSVHSPTDPIRSPVYSPMLQHQTHSRHRPPERHRVSQEDLPIRQSHVEDLHHHPPQSSYFPPQHSRQQFEHEHHVQQLELQRQHQHHEQLLLQEHQQQKQLVHERQFTHTDGSVPQQQIPFLPLHVEAPSRPLPPSSVHAPGRKSDSGQLHRIISSPHADHIPHPSTSTDLPRPQLASDETSSHPSKRRRYSDSPVQSVPIDGKDRFRHERDKMTIGDLGYGRVDSAAMATASFARRPGSGYGHGKKPMGVVEPPLTAELEREHSNVAGGSFPVAEKMHGQRLLSPPSRRSPPGSQIGRAKAARKSEEVDRSLDDLLSDVASEKQVHEKEERKKFDPRPSKEPQHTSPEILPPQRVKQRPRPVPKSKEEDAHEWFLEHFDEDPAPAAHEPPLSPALQEPLIEKPRLSTLSPPVLPTPRSTAFKKQSPALVMMPDDVVTLEQELEDLVAEQPIRIGKVEPDIDLDMDVDRVVTELVAETLEADDTKIEDVGMEVDVEDELLSLVDDRPLPPHSNRRPSVKSSTPASIHKPLPLRAVVASQYGQRVSPTTTSSVLKPSVAGHMTPVMRQSSSQPTIDRGSMPPPTSVASGRSKEKEDKHGERASSVTATAGGSKRKKDGSSKPGTKPKGSATTTAASKPRAKPGPKPKMKSSDGSTATASIKSKNSVGPPKKGSASRSRSTSVMPSGSAGPDGNDAKAEQQEEEEEEADHEDDKLYCVCKTKYDEDRFMIACDRCDEWYHTQCVEMPDLEVDLVDQFICPPCIAKNPELSLRTTYKLRCLYGLRSADPSSPKACHRPARGAFSKYCSDECGVKYMQSRAEAWAKKGGKKERLWETVKNAEKREGVVICTEEPAVAKMEVDQVCLPEVIKPKKGKVEREIERLHVLLDSVVKLREEIKKGLEGVVWREKLLELATERSEQVQQCGWDQRLCFGDDEWADFGAGTLESYEDLKTERVNGQGDMQGAGPAEGEGEWWCPGKQVCDRHAGWQTVRYRDVSKEREKKEDALLNLTTREREIRKQIEDILDPHGHGCKDSSGKSLLKASNAKLANGHAKGKTNGDVSKKGKKRKAMP